MLHIHVIYYELVVKHFFVVSFIFILLVVLIL